MTDWTLKEHVRMPDGVVMYWLTEGLSIGTADRSKAELAAAAPALLEALGEAATSLRSAAEILNGNGYDTEAAELLDAEHDARAAAALAKGEAK